MSAGRVFLDTNIFVYLWAPAADAKSTLAKNLIDSTAQSGDACITAQVAQEFFNVAFNKFPGRMSAPQAEQFLALVLSAFRWVPVDSMVMSKGMLLRNRHQLAWYDSLIIAAALEAECSVLYSEDFQDGQIFEGTLTVVNPFAAHKN